MKKLICSILCLLVVLYSFPFSAFATDYGSYCSDEVVYPPSDVPDFSSYITNPSCINFLVYNSLDSCYYLFYSYPYGNSYNISISYNGLYLYCYLSKGNIRLCKYDPANSNTWVQIVSDYANLSSSSKNLFSVSLNFKYKYLWCSSNFTFTDNGYVYTVTNQNSNLSSTDIYANFFDPTGVYLNNDSNNGSDEPSEPGSVDLTTTNNLLSSLGDKLDDLIDDVVSSNSFLSNISSKVNTIQSDLAASKSSIITIATSVSEGGYIASRINTLQSDVGTIKNNVFTISTSVSEGGYIASRINTMQSDIVAIKTNTGNLNSALGDTGYIGSRVNTISNNLSQLITVLSTKLDTVNSNLALINQDLTRNANNEPATTLFKTLGDFYSSFNSFYNYFTNDFVDMWGTAMSMIYEAMTTFYNTTFPAFISTMNTRFEELYNVIIYGDKRGGQAIENEKQQVEEFGEDLDEVSSHLDDASTVIDGASAGVTSYIQTFTDFYNGFTALNAGISAVFLFALVFIFVKKAIGR